MNPSHQNEKFLKVAVDLANKNVRLYRAKPFGAVIVKGNTIVSMGVNEVLRTNDPTAHAELQAIRAAAEKLNSADLTGCVLYASGHPCPMCLAASYLAGITSIFYYGSLEEAARAGFGVDEIYEEVGKPNSHRRYPLQKIQLKEVPSPFDTWTDIVDTQGR